MAKLESPIRGVVHRGVMVESRHNIISEIKKMQEIVDKLFSSRIMISRIWDDSNLGSCYEITVRKGVSVDQQFMEFLRGVGMAAGGYNYIGVYEEGGDRTQLGYLEAEWVGDPE